MTHRPSQHTVTVGVTLQFDDAIASTSPPLVYETTSVLAAVSGGPDSMAMLHLFLRLLTLKRIAVLEVAHINHCLRGAESEQDSEFVAEWCNAHGLAFHSVRVDVQNYQKIKKVGMEEAARNLRHSALQAILTDRNASVIAFGHHADDRIETAFLNILRGCGIDGIAAMPLRSGNIIRPCLTISRQLLAEYCKVNDVPFRTDSTNKDPSVSKRNRVRLTLLPQLAEDYGQSSIEAVSRLMETADAESDYLSQTCNTLLDGMIRTTDNNGIVLERQKFALQHLAIQRRLLRLATLRLRGTSEGMTFKHSEAIICAVRAGETNASVTLPYPQVEIVLNLNSIRVTHRTNSTHHWKTIGAQISLTAPGTTLWALSPGEIVTERICVADSHFQSMRESDLRQTLAPAQLCDESIFVRTWRTGDTVRPFGMGGHSKKLQDVFTDRRVSTQERHLLPVIANTAEVLWVPGIVASELLRVQSTHHQAFLLTWIPNLQPQEK